MISLTREALAYMEERGYHSFYLSRPCNNADPGRCFLSRYRWFREDYYLFVENLPWEEPVGSLYNKLRGDQPNQVIFKAVQRDRLA